jgi:hypothetical protein
MSIDDIQNQLQLYHTKLRIVNSNGNYKQKEKIQNQIKILNFKLEIETIKKKISQLESI